MLDLLLPSMELIAVAKDESLFEPGDDVSHIYFPLGETVLALTLPLQDGRAIETATIGREGALGGVATLATISAFARASVRVPGEAARISVQKLEDAKSADPSVHDIFSRYTDCLIAQILQSVACATVHPLEARCARWLLMMHDRLQQPELPLTQEALAEMFGVARTYVTRIARKLEQKGAIAYQRGIIRIQDRSVLEESTCECYDLVRRHFERVLPGVYPAEEP